MAQDTHSQQLVIFTLGLEQYALPIGRVQEIIHYQQPRSLVSDDSSVRGVINLRGRIVPVHDLGVRMGVEAEVGGHGKIVVLESDDQTVGVMVDSVDEVLTVADDQVERAPTADDATLVDSIAKIGDRLVILLNPSAVIGTLPLAA
jgi:purine-binding chemotaxis protein CheW